MRRLEALADGIARYSGYYDPESEVYQARNPGSLKARSLGQAATPSGKRVFKSHIDGYQALIFDLAIKCSGRSNTALRPTSTLRELLLSYGQPATAAIYVAKYLRRALLDHSINPDTPLEFFLESE